MTIPVAVRVTLFGVTSSPVIGLILIFSEFDCPFTRLDRGLASRWGRVSFIVGSLSRSALLSYVPSALFRFISILMSSLAILDWIITLPCLICAFLSYFIIFIHTVCLVYPFVLMNGPDSRPFLKFSSNCSLLVPHWCWVFIGISYFIALIKCIYCLAI